MLAGRGIAPRHGLLGHQQALYRARIHLDLDQDLTLLRNEGARALEVAGLEHPYLVDAMRARARHGAEHIHGSASRDERGGELDPARDGRWLGRPLRG